MAVFLFFWISPAVNSTKSFKYLAEKGYCWFSELFAMLFMQLKGNVGSWQVTHYGRTRNDKAYKFIL